MQVYTFTNLDGISDYTLESWFKTLLDRERVRYRDFDYNNYTWTIGLNVANRLLELSHTYNFPMDVEGSNITKLFGINLMVINYHSPNIIYLRKGRIEPIDTRRISLCADFLNDMRRIEEKKKKEANADIKKVIFNDPATIVYWTDGTKTVVKAENEPFDSEKGLAMAISKKFLGNRGNYYNTFRRWL